MLVLTRKNQEQIRIGDIVVKVACIQGDRVRLGIEAPRDVPVHREEIYQRQKIEGIKRCQQAQE